MCCSNISQTVGTAADDAPLVSCTYFVYDAWSRILSFANAGHQPPLLVLDGEVTEMEADGAGAMLGVRRPGLGGDIRYEEETRELAGKGIRGASSAMTVMRGIVGFMTFSLAFAMRGGRKGLDLHPPGAAVGAAATMARKVKVVTDSGSSTPLPQQRLDATELGESKFLTLIEAPMQPGTPFESITNPGHGLTLQGWPDQQAAEASLAPLAGAMGRRRIVRVIRDYGMRDRAEAPTYFPPVA